MPYPTDPSKVGSYEDANVIPQYRALWYRTCYNPYRGMSTGSYPGSLPGSYPGSHPGSLPGLYPGSFPGPFMYNRGMGMADALVHGAMNTMNTAMGFGHHFMGGFQPFFYR